MGVERGARVRAARQRVVATGSRTCSFDLKPRSKLFGRFGFAESSHIVPASGTLERFFRPRGERAKTTMALHAALATRSLSRDESSLRVLDTATRIRVHLEGTRGGRKWQV